MPARSHDRTFTPAEIDAIAGLSTGLQREWRRQRILPEKTDRGWTRATLDLVVWIFVLKRLADAGFPLKEAQKAAEAALPFVMEALAIYASAASAKAREALSNQITTDLSSWRDDVAHSQWITESKARHPTRASYLLFTRAHERACAEAGHVIPISGLEDVPDDLVVWTVMDLDRAAMVVLDGIRRVRCADNGSE